MDVQGYPFMLFCSYPHDGLTQRIDAGTAFSWSRHGVAKSHEWYKFSFFPCYMCVTIPKFLLGLSIQRLGFQKKGASVLMELRIWLIPQPEGSPRSLVIIGKSLVICDWCDWLALAPFPSEVGLCNLPTFYSRVVSPGSTPCINLNKLI